MHFACFSLFFFNFHRRKLTVAVIFSFFLPSPKELSPACKIQKPFPKHHSYCFPRQQILYRQRHTRNGKREFQTPLQNTGLLKDLQELYFNLVLICLRVYLFRGGGELADICFLNIQWHRFIFPPQYLLAKSRPLLLTKIENQFDYSIVNRLLGVLQL